MKRHPVATTLLLSLLACHSAHAQDPFSVPILPANTVPGAPSLANPLGASLVGAGPGASVPIVASPAPGSPVGPSPVNQAQPFDPRHPLAGTFLFTGTDRSGPYSGTLLFRATPNGGYTYQRTFNPDPRTRRRAAGDNGVAELKGTHVYTRQVTQSGLSSLFTGGTQRRLRHGFYRLEPSYKKGTGFTYLSHYERGNEKLQRIGPDMDNNHVQLLIDGGEFFPMLRAELMAAKYSINMQFYIFTDDPTGKWVGELLAQKAREGVRVRLMMDDFDSWISDELMALLRRSGAEVIIQNDRQTGMRNSLKALGRSILTLGGLLGKKRQPKRGLFNHDHRKIVTIDGRVGFIGGMNIAQHYNVWHDIHSRVEGNVVRDMEALFFDGWTQAGGAVGQVAPPDPIVTSGAWWPGSMDVELVDQLPGVRKDIKRRYLSEIAIARRTIHIENAFFLHEGVINALQRKARAGVDVVVIIPTDQYNNSAIVQEAFNWVQNDVVRSGVKLYKYRDRMTHGKVAVFDGLVSTVGSANLDDLALEKLYEANLFINDDRGFARVMEDRVFRTDLPKSDRVGIKKQRLGERIKSGLLHLFRGFL